MKLLRLQNKSVGWSWWNSACRHHN
jgi:hypothetical protein